MTTVNNLGESGSPCLTPLLTENSLDTNLFKCILAVAWLKTFCKLFIYVSFMLAFLEASKRAKCSTVPTDLS